MESGDERELSNTQMAELSARLDDARRFDRAPAALRQRIEADRAGLRPRARPRPWHGLSPWPAVGLAGAVAAVVVALVLLLPAGTPASPTLAQAAALASRGPAGAAPAADPHAAGWSLVHVGRVAFPLALPGGLRATGQRRDRIDGRLVVTVFYGGRAGRVAYSILAAPALPAPMRYAAEPIRGFYTLTLGRRPALTWQEYDHTCLISGTGLPAPLLATLVHRLVRYR